MSERIVRFGLFGAGTVGGSVVRILRKRKAEFREDGYNFILEKICEKDARKRKALGLGKEHFTSSPSKILNDPRIDLVIELIGGEHPASEIIDGALSKRKSVITANKKIVAERGPSLAKKAKKNRVYFGFRAAITGCHVIMDQLVHGGPINSVVGVFNGTCNYILTRMKELSMEQSEVISEAQRLGYAEKNPSLDIDGFDTEYKVRILSMLTFGFKVPQERMFVEGIRGVTLEDIKFADELGYEIRLLGIINRIGSSMDVRVHPALVPKGTKFAMLKGVQNCIDIDDLLRGRGGAIYEGAGGAPAASAVIQDLIDAADRIRINWPPGERLNKGLTLLRQTMLKSKYYLLFKAVNKPGVLAGICSALARYNINIAKVEQIEEEYRGIIPIVITTDEAREQDVHRALRRTGRLNLVRGRPKLIRILDKLIT